IDGLVEMRDLLLGLLEALRDHRAYFRERCGLLAPGADARSENRNRIGFELPRLGRLDPRRRLRSAALADDGFDIALDNPATGARAANGIEIDPVLLGDTLGEGRDLHAPALARGIHDRQSGRGALCTL